MNNEQKQRDWNKRILAFNEEYRGRPTRIGVFDSSDGALDDYWLESGLLLNGVAVEGRNGKLTAEILLDGMAHMVADAEKIEFVYDARGENEGMNVIDSEGRTTILRFEEFLN